MREVLDRNTDDPPRAALVRDQSLVVNIPGAEPLEAEDSGRAISIGVLGFMAWRYLAPKSWRENGASNSSTESTDK